MNKRTLMYDVARCAGRSVRTEFVCPERFTCQRWLAYSEWDKEFGIESYRGISVFVAQEGCDVKIEVEP